METYHLEAERLIGRTLINELIDTTTGEIVPIKIVTDNGPAFHSAVFARYIRRRPEFEHIRTRHKSPHTNGIRERGFGSLKYEHLYRHEIHNSAELAEHVEAYRTIFNKQRPHEALDWKRPKKVYLASTPTHQPVKPEQDS